MQPKYIEYAGLRFCRDEKTGYYLNSTIRKRLHRYVWEQERGPIPAGCHVHHINGDKSDNSIENLQLLTGQAHHVLHGADPALKDKMRENMKRAEKAAKNWHSSEEGLRWHSEHMKGFKQPRTEKICEWCGKTYSGTKNARFCSNACRAANRRAQGADLVPSTCELCGRPFMMNKYKPARYCSRECVHKAHIGWYERRQSGD